MVISTRRLSKWARAKLSSTGQSRTGDVLRRTPGYVVFRRLNGTVLKRRWQRAGKQGSPPHIVKAQTVREYAAAFEIDVFVETGTYLGHMVQATKKTFSRIYSIELDDELYQRAKAKFANSGHIEILHGDSARVLSALLPHISSQCLFWLDAHYSGGITAKGNKDTPILDELALIFGDSTRDHVLLIDDARLFTGSDGYPTLREVEEFIRDARPDLTVHIRDDIIRIHHPRL